MWKKKKEIRQLKPEDYKALNAKNKKEAEKQKEHKSLRDKLSEDALMRAPEEMLPVEQGPEEAKRFAGQKPFAENISELTYEDYLAFTKVAISPKIKRRLVLYPGGSIFVAIVILVVTLYRGDFNAIIGFLALGLTMFGLIMLYVFFIRMPRDTARSYLNHDIKMMGMGGGKPRRTYRFYADGAATATADGRHNTFGYERLYKLYETDELFAFSLGMEAGYVLRKDSFTKGSLEQVKAKMQSYLDAKKKKKKKD